MGQKRVLRITTIAEGNSKVLKLEGKVDGPWVDVLRKSWTDATSRMGQQPIIVDLSSVTSADARGRLLLLEMQNQGGRLMGSSAFLRHVLEQDGAQLPGHSDLQNQKGD